MARSSKPLVRLREQAQVGSIPTRLRQPNRYFQLQLSLRAENRQPANLTNLGGIHYYFSFRTNVRTTANYFMITFQTSPDQYRHWKLAIEGAAARLTMDVQEDETLADGYKLKLNSYDLGVDI